MIRTIIILDLLCNKDQIKADLNEAKNESLTINSGIQASVSKSTSNKVEQMETLSSNLIDKSTKLMRKIMNNAKIQSDIDDFLTESFYLSK